MNVKHCEYRGRRCFSPATVTVTTISGPPTTSGTPFNFPTPSPYRSGSAAINGAMGAATVVTTTASCVDHLPKVEAPYQRCDYTSNRTRLRCQSVRHTKDLRAHGFCEKHSGFIERVKKAGARARRILDPGFDLSGDGNSLKPVELSDTEQDEALIPSGSSANESPWPCVHESLYCTARVDDEENPLRNAGTCTQRESLREYLRVTEHQKTVAQQLRLHYAEKLHRLHAQRKQQAAAMLMPPPSSHAVGSRGEHGKSAVGKGKRASDKKQLQGGRGDSFGESVDRRLPREHKANKRYGRYVYWNKTSILMAKAKKKMSGLSLGNTAPQQQHSQTLPTTIAQPPTGQTTANTVDPSSIPSTSAAVHTQGGCRHVERLVKGRTRLPLAYKQQQLRHPTDNAATAVGGAPTLLNGAAIEESVRSLLHGVLDHVESSLNAVPGHPGWVDVVETRECNQPRLPLADFCPAHVLSDQQQTLFERCSDCESAALPLGGGGWNRCKRHSTSLHPLPAGYSTTPAHQLHSTVSGQTALEGGGSNLNVPLRQNFGRQVAGGYVRRSVSGGQHFVYYAAPSPQQEGPGGSAGGPSYVLLPQTSLMKGQAPSTSSAAAMLQDGQATATSTPSSSTTRYYMTSPPSVALGGAGGSIGGTAIPSGAGGTYSTLAPPGLSAGGQLSSYPSSSSSSPSSSSTAIATATNYKWLSTVNRREPKEIGDATTANYPYVHPQLSVGSHLGASPYFAGGNAKPFSPLPDGHLLLRACEQQGHTSLGGGSSTASSSASSTSTKRVLSVEEDMEDATEFIRECEDAATRRTSVVNHQRLNTHVPVYVSTTATQGRGGFGVRDNHLSQAANPTMMMDGTDQVSPATSTGHKKKGAQRTNSVSSTSNGTTAGGVEAAMPASKDTETCARCRPFEGKERNASGTHQRHAGASSKKSKSSTKANHRPPHLGGGVSPYPPLSPYGTPVIYHHQQQHPQTGLPMTLKRQHTFISGGNSIGGGGGGNGGFQPSGPKVARMITTSSPPFQGSSTRLVPSSPAGHVAGSGGGGAGGMGSPAVLPPTRVIYNGGLGSVIHPHQQATTYYTASGNRIFRAPYLRSNVDGPPLNTAVVRSASGGIPSSGVAKRPVAVIALPAGTTPTDLYSRMGGGGGGGGVMVRSPHGPPPTLYPAEEGGNPPLSTRPSSQSDGNEGEESSRQRAAIGEKVGMGSARIVTLTPMVASQGKKDGGRVALDAVAPQPYGPER